MHDAAALNGIGLTGEKFLVLPDPMDEKSAAGLSIPEAAQERKKTGVVALRAVGAHPAYQVGVRVQWMNHSSPVPIGGVDYLLLDDTDIAFHWKPGA